MLSPRHEEEPTFAGSCGVKGRAMPSRVARDSAVAGGMSRARTHMEAGRGVPASLLEFDVAGTAGWYSSIVGVLAGFALLAILIPLDHEAAHDDDRSADTVVIMTCAFFSLLLLSFSYAILAGRVGDTERGQAVHEQLLLGVAVGLSSLLLMFALNTLLASDVATTMIRCAGSNARRLAP